MEGTGDFVGRRRGTKVELLPGEFEVFTRRARRGWQSGRLVFTNQRFIWWPSFKRADDVSILRVEHERVARLDIVRPWQRLFLERALRLRLQTGEQIYLIIRDVETILPTVRSYMANSRYRPGELFK